MGEEVGHASEIRVHNHRGDRKSEIGQPKRKTQQLTERKTNENMLFPGRILPCRVGGGVGEVALGGGEREICPGPHAFKSVKLTGPLKISFDRSSGDPVENILEITVELSPTRALLRYDIFRTLVRGFFLFSRGLKAFRLEGVLDRQFF